MGEKIAIVGSREWPINRIASVRAAIRDFVFSLPKDAIIISGEARGVDSWAKEEADQAGLVYMSYPPRYDLHPPAIAPLIRNKEIARACDSLIAFQWKNSRGTEDVVEATRRLGKPVRVVGDSELDADPDSGID